jgi:hypothetical protein
MESGAIRSSKKIFWESFSGFRSIQYLFQAGGTGGRVSKSCQPDIPAIVIGRYYDTGQPRIDACR